MAHASIAGTNRTAGLGRRSRRPMTRSVRPRGWACPTSAQPHKPSCNAARSNLPNLFARVYVRAIPAVSFTLYIHNRLGRLGRLDQASCGAGSSCLTSSDAAQPGWAGWTGRLSRRAVDHCAERAQLFGQTKRYSRQGGTRGQKDRVFAVVAGSIVWSNPQVVGGGCGGI
jgi:hypothetical protein